MNTTQKMFVHATAEEKADLILVELITKAMKIKLNKKRTEGRGGWFREGSVTDNKLLNMLKEHIEKGDMIDVINLAAMIHVRSELNK